MLVILLYSVLCLISTAVRRVEGEKRGGESKDYTTVDEQAPYRAIHLKLISAILD